jgi:archaellum component FlaC
MAKMQEFFNRQHEQLTKLETLVVQTKKELEEARSEARANLREMRDETRFARQALQEDIADAYNKMKASMEARKKESQATIEEWKRKREVTRLENRARDLEEYADAATDVARLALEEARAASLDAVEARRVADEAK